MDESREEDKGRDAGRHGECYCPVCTMGRIIRVTRKRHRSFFEHISNARMEVLRAVRSLVDEKIDSIEKRKASEERKGSATKIEVE
jgi:hypothetical protein